MTRHEKFEIAEFVISVDHGSYLVEIAHSENFEAKHSLDDLPLWVFRSRYAIWLSAGDAPIRVRALEGEQMKQYLLKRFPEIISA